MLLKGSPGRCIVVIKTGGYYNMNYYEKGFLAQEHNYAVGIEAVMMLD